MNNQGNYTTDRVQITDMLCTEKHMALVYSIECCETATPTLRETMMSILREEHQMCGELFDAMNSRGWYPVEKAEEQKLQEAKQQFSQMASV